MEGITQNKKESLIFNVIRNHRKQLKVISTTYVKNGKDSDNSDNSNISEKDKYNIGDKDNNSNIKLT